MKKTNSKSKTFAEWAKEQSPQHKKIIAALRKLVKKTAPTLIETVKWTNGCWIGEEYPVIFLHAKEDHLQFGFFAGSDLTDPGSLLQGSGKYIKHVKVFQLSDIREAAFSRFIRQAVKLERS